MGDMKQLTKLIIIRNALRGADLSAVTPCGVNACVVYIGYLPSTLCSLIGLVNFEVYDNRFNGNCGAIVILLEARLMLSCCALCRHNAIVYVCSNSADNS